MLVAMSAENLGRFGRGRLQDDQLNGVAKCDI